MKLFLLSMTILLATPSLAGEKANILAECENQKAISCTSLATAEDKLHCLNTMSKSLERSCIDKKSDYIRKSKDGLQKSISDKFKNVEKSGKEELVKIKSNIDEIEKINNLYGGILRTQSEEIHTFSKNFRDVFTPKLDQAIPALEAAAISVDQAATSNDLVKESAKLNGILRSQFTEIGIKRAELYSIKFRTSFIKDNYQKALLPFESFAKEHGIVIEDSIISSMNQSLEKIESNLIQRKSRLVAASKLLDDSMDKKLSALVAKEAKVKVENDTIESSKQNRRNAFRTVVDKHINRFNADTASKYQGIPFQSESWSAMKEINSIIQFCEQHPDSEVYGFGCLRASQFKSAVSSKQDGAESYINITLEHLDSTKDKRESQLRNTIKSLVSRKSFDEAVLAFDKLLVSLGGQ